jgi:DNA-binding response OmpR family regulator
VGNGKSRLYGARDVVLRVHPELECHAPVVRPPAGNRRRAGIFGLDDNQPTRNELVQPLEVAAQLNHSGENDSIHWARGGYPVARSQLMRRAVGGSSEKVEGARFAPRILIVEDNLRYAIELMRTLRQSQGQISDVHFQIDLTPTAEEALQFLEKDEIDIYIVDLKLPNIENLGVEDESVGENLVGRILEKTNAGVIVHSLVPAERNAEVFLLLGADDYIEKTAKLEFVRAKLLALWRRVQLTRPEISNAYAHTNRTFLIGDWRFVIGSRELRGESGNMIRVSPTEHAFLRHICAVEDHEIDRETFNASVLGRSAVEKDSRIDNLIYRLRNKLGQSVQFLSKREGIYKLIDIKEVRPATK